MDIKPIRNFRDAEHNACAFLRRLGFIDAALTSHGADGGVDVRGAGIVAQVKAEVAPVGPAVCQALFGNAAIEGAAGAVFALAGFTRQARQWADRAGLALFEFDLTGAATPVNGAGRGLHGPEVSLELVRQVIEWAADENALSIPPGHLALKMEVPREGMNWSMAIAEHLGTPDTPFQFFPLGADDSDIDAADFFRSQTGSVVLALPQPWNCTESVRGIVLQAVRDCVVAPIDGPMRTSVLPIPVHPIRLIMPMQSEDEGPLYDWIRTQSQIAMPPTLPLHNSLLLRKELKIMQELLDTLRDINTQTAVAEHPPNEPSR